MKSLANFAEKDLVNLIPILLPSRHKGENGKIGVIGGSFEYTGAPFYSALTSLKGGGDLAHIFCTEQAGIPIKSYSPEIIVHPYLKSTYELPSELKQRIKEKPDITKKIYESYAQECIESVTKWYPALHSVILGPGLGRDDLIATYITEFINHLRNNQIAILDADSLWYLSDHDIKEDFKKALMKHSQNCILTPNKVEFDRLWKGLNKDKEQTNKDEYNFAIKEFSNKYSSFEEVDIQNAVVRDTVELSRILNNITILRKGEMDVITDGNQAYIVKEEGSFKRCGGQGDILSGLIGIYAYWASIAKTKEKEFKIMHGCILASIINRRSAKLAFDEQCYGLTTPHIIEKVGAVITSVAKNSSNSEKPKF